MANIRKFKTIIEIESVAVDSHEAIDIAGEYLRGNISSGVKLKCYSHPIRNFCSKISLLLCQFI
jgi:hypothetical protein